MNRHNTLLVVDDNAPTRYAIRRTLERHGYTVLEAGTGTEGLQVLASRQVDGLVLDVNLPDMSGFDIVRTLRSRGEDQLVPVVHVSAASIDTSDIVAGLDNGADAYLTHPVDPGVLLATVRTLLRVRDAERALRESEARTREIFTTIAAPMAVVDADLTVVERNDAFMRVVEEAGEIETLADAFEPGQDAAVEAMRDALSGVQRWRGVINMRSSRGTREMEWRITPYRDRSGMVFVDDVTEQRRREREQLQQIDTANTQLAVEIAERERTEKQLMQVQKMDALGKLTGGIAHDFNNLLTSIITGIDLINRQIEAGDASRVQRFADTALGSARRAAALTHRLLAFARQQPLDARATDVNESIRSLEDMLRRTIGETVELRLELAYGRMIASVDANQLENAVLNLVINARDAMPAGGRITLSSRLEHVPGGDGMVPGSYVVLSVADTGVGIPPELIEKVFEPFFTTKPIGKGTGLGLSTIYGFARQSGGEARISSVVGQGTSVALWLPAGEGEVEPVKPRSTSVEGGRGERVLLVEDTDSLRQLASEVLRMAGYECVATGDIQEALRYLRGDEPVHLLVTDIGMPDMDGRELANTARAWRPALPVLFMTGYAENAMEPGRFLGDGMDMILKPFEVNALLERVRSMLD